VGAGGAGMVAEAGGGAGGPGGGLSVRWECLRCSWTRDCL